MSDDEAWIDDLFARWEPFRQEVTRLQDHLDKNPGDELGWTRLATMMRKLGNPAAEAHCRARLEALRALPAM